MVVFSFLAPPRDALALDPGKALTQYGHDTWKTREGLPQDTVQAVVQGRDGYLWLATSVGLVRFDGVRFTLLDKDAGLAHDNAWGLCLAHDGALWIGTDGGGVSRMKEGQITSFSTANGLSNDFVRAIREGPDGTIWMATRGGGVNRYKDGAFTRIRVQDGLPSDIVWALHADREGGVWVGTNGGGLTLLKDGRFKTYTKSEGLPHNSIWYLYEDRHRTLWIGTSLGLARLEDGRFRTYTTKDGLAGDFVRDVHEDRHGNLWIGTTTGLSRLRDGRIDSFPAGHGLAGEFVRSIHEDREGSLWVGTSAGGLHRLRDGRFTVHGRPEGLSHDLTRAVVEARDGSVWVATGDARLSRLRDGRFTEYTVEGGLPASNLASLAEGRDGSVWFGTSGGGLCNLKNERFRCYLTGDGLPGNVVPAVLEDSQGRLWAGTAAGLARLEGGRFIPYTSRDGLPADFVRTLLESRDGRVWIGTTGGLASWHRGAITAWTEMDGLGRGGVEALHEDAEGALWIGTRGGGLSRLAGGRIRTITKRDGLADDVIYAILGDGRGSLWLSSPRGISRVETTSLRAFLDGTLPRVSSVSYDASDGMRSSESTPGSPGGWRARDGRLWFATVRGLVSVDPRDARSNRLAPPVVIEEVRVDDRPTRNPQAVVVPAGTEQLAFRYTGLSFLVPAKVRFRYMLEGFDDDWTEAGTRREAYYTNVPPGRYRFRVTACNNDGVWSEPASLALTLPPLFHQTRTFLALCALGIVLSGAGLHRLRVRRLRLRERELLGLVDERTHKLAEEKERAERAGREAEDANAFKTELLRIAAHDLKNPLTAVLMRAEVMQDGTFPPTAAAQMSATIYRVSRRMLRLVDGLLTRAALERGTLELSLARVDLGGLVASVADDIRPQAERKKQALLVQAQDTVAVQADEDRLREVIENLVSNAIKYSGEGTTVTLSVRRGPGTAQVEVCDQGPGLTEKDQSRLFQPFARLSAQPTAGESSTGLGLSIVKRLVELHGGRVSAESPGPQQGTRFVVELPADGEA